MISGRSVERRAAPRRIDDRGELSAGEAPSPDEIVRRAIGVHLAAGAASPCEEQRRTRLLLALHTARTLRVAPRSAAPAAPRDLARLAVAQLAEHGLSMRVIELLERQGWLWVSDLPPTIEALDAHFDAVRGSDNTERRNRGYTGWGAGAADELARALLAAGRGERVAPRPHGGITPQMIAQQQQAASRRDEKILALLAAGHSQLEIASELHASAGWVHKQVSRLRVAGRVQAPPPGRPQPLSRDARRYGRTASVHQQFVRRARSSGATTAAIVVALTAAGCTLAEITDAVGCSAKYATELVRQARWRGKLPPEAGRGWYASREKEAKKRL